MAVRHLPVVAAAIVALSLPALAAESSVPTRYGPVGVANGNDLTFQGKPLSPAIHGISGLAVSRDRIYPVGDVDLVIVTDTGPPPCPFRFRIATVGKSGTRVTKAFGNCGKDLTVKVVAGELNMTLPSRNAPPPKPAKITAGKPPSTKTPASDSKVPPDVYLYDPAGGQLTENGLPAK